MKYMLPYTFNIVSPPGDTIKDLLEEKEISEFEFSRWLFDWFDNNNYNASLILNGSQCINEDIAEFLSSQIAGTKEFWLAREEHYRNSLHEYYARKSRQENFMSVPVRFIQEYAKDFCGRELDSLELAQFEDFVFCDSIAFTNLLTYKMFKFVESKLLEFTEDYELFNKLVNAKTKSEKTKYGIYRTFMLDENSDKPYEEPGLSSIKRLSKISAIVEAFYEEKFKQELTNG